MQLTRVVETGSLSAAARALGVGQPAISKTVAQLEARLGVRLLLRSSHALTPTQAGQSFYEGARRALEAADEAEQAARGAGASLVGRLRACAAVTFARLHIIPRLPAFLAAHPDLDMDCILDDRTIDLLAEGVDVAIRMGQLVDSAMTTRRLGRSPRLVMATPAYLARAGVPATPAARGEHAAIVHTQEAGVDTLHFTRDGADASVAIGGRLRVSAAEGVRAAVLADMGLAVVSAWMFGPELASGAVLPVLTGWTLPPVDSGRSIRPAGCRARRRGPSRRSLRPSSATTRRACRPRESPTTPGSATLTILCLDRIDLYERSLP